MERKKVQRIIGVIVVIALAIVLMPLVFQKNDNSIKTAAAKTPAFPEETQTRTVNELTDPDVVSSDSKNMDPINIAPKMADAANQKYQMTPINPPLDANSANQKDTPILQTASSAASDESSELENEDQAKSQDNTKQHTPATKQTKPVLTEKNKKDVAKDSHSNQTLHRTAWVVQLGSFREKNNARRLANKLRNAGFKAFMHAVKSKKGEQTRVYIGPESKLAEANSLSKKIEQQLNLKGIIVSYKPLEL